jgi:signal transduction histidine kinase
MSLNLGATEFEEYRDMALNNTHYLEHLVSDIMDYSMISKGKLRVVPAIFKLDALLANIHKLFADQCKMRGI